MFRYLWEGYHFKTPAPRIPHSRQEILLRCCSMIANDMKKPFSRTLLIFSLLLSLLAATMRPTGWIRVANIEFLAIRFKDISPFDWDTTDEKAEELGVALRIEGIYGFDKETVFLYGALGSRSLLLRSADGGMTWQETMDPVYGSSVLHMTFLEDGQGWTVSAWMIEGTFNPTIYHSPDYGLTWAEIGTIPSDRIVPYGIRFFGKKHGQMKIANVFANPYTDRLAILTTNDGGHSWKETDNVPIWEEWDGVSTPVQTISFEEHHVYFSALAGWSSSNDGYGCSERCESSGPNDHQWLLEHDKPKATATLSYFSYSKNDWLPVSSIPLDWNYLNGMVTPLSKWQSAKVQ